MSRALNTVVWKHAHTLRGRIKGVVRGQTDSRQPTVFTITDVFLRPRGSDDGRSIVLSRSAYLACRDLTLTAWGGHLAAGHLVSTGLLVVLPLFFLLRSFCFDC